ncbi:MAG: DUF1335 domain-containing protein [Mangrovimonas sp.]|nr:DUF1335 domain-containing protein [Mangrovimonas sp.]MCB0433790.1 DUF1335 domain-containing protein [Mangrovimonas sp.]
MSRKKIGARFNWISFSNLKTRCIYLIKGSIVEHDIVGSYHIACLVISSQQLNIIFSYNIQNRD